MENASKALIMAGEILIGVLVLTLVIYGYSNLRSISEINQTTEEIEQLTVFNTEYESYNKKLLRGVDLISVMNKTIDNNNKYENAEYYKINIEFKIIEGGTIPKGTYGINYYVSYIKNNTEAFTELKRKIFSCTKVEYGSDSGRISYMLYEERISEGT